MRRPQGLNFFKGGNMPVPASPDKTFNQSCLPCSDPGFLGPFFRKKFWRTSSFLLVGTWCLITASALAQGPTFRSFFTKDLNQLIPATSFSKSDRIYLYTVWTGLTGDHDLKILWIRPDKQVQETTRFKVKIPPKTPNYTSWAWLSFKKSLLDVMSTEGKFIGPWRVKLFLDEKFLQEYTFTVF
jgi:hypothetical protein